ncbi:hypothetical protein BCY88_10125 [Paraburkholderia fungorum]|uniref:Uncharacterized protein n=1 Tax=Paraburkholderia fungorum TaxID=134537 RepID=A0A3R7HK52_9BURK|nr:hypothetical protein BCY88_10125 [Paraburkholderia fungorum]
MWAGERDATFAQALWPDRVQTELAAVDTINDCRIAGFFSPESKPLISIGAIAVFPDNVVKPAEMAAGLPVNDVIAPRRQRPNHFLFDGGRIISTAIAARERNKVANACALQDRRRFGV